MKQALDHPLTRGPTWCLQKNCRSYTEKLYKHIPVLVHASVAAHGHNKPGSSFGGTDYVRKSFQDGRMNASAGTSEGCEINFCNFTKCGRGGDGSRGNDGQRGKCRWENGGG